MPALVRRYTRCACCSGSEFSSPQRGSQRLARRSSVSLLVCVLGTCLKINCTIQHVHVSGYEVTNPAARTSESPVHRGPRPDLLSTITQSRLSLTDCDSSVRRVNSHRARAANAHGKLVRSSAARAAARARARRAHRQSVTGNPQFIVMPYAKSTITPV